MSDEVNVKTPLFSFGVKKQEQYFEVEEGKRYILRFWSWRKFGYIKKLITVRDGRLIVEVIS